MRKRIKRSIKGTLMKAFLVPVLFIIILGTVSYVTASNTIRSKVEESSMSNELALEDVKVLETRTNIPAIQRYLEGDVDADNWSRYRCRLKGVGLIQSVTENNKFAWVTPIFPETTSTMETNWANLEKLEEETFIKIVTGEIDVESGFEQFVTDWHAQGGEQIIKEISEQLQ